MKITDELMSLIVTENGGLLKNVNSIITGTQRLRKGWKKRFIGLEISSLQVLKILRLNEAWNKKIRNRPSKKVNDCHEIDVTELAHSNLDAELSAIVGQVSPIKCKREWYETFDPSLGLAPWESRKYLAESKTSL